MNMTRAAIYEAITAERARQDEKHPVAFYALLPPGMNIKDIESCLFQYRLINNLAENKNEHSAYEILQEEVCEFFAETEKARQVEEAIQNAAYWVRIIEEITK